MGRHIDRLSCSQYVGGRAFQEAVGRYVWELRGGSMGPCWKGVNGVRSGDGCCVVPFSERRWRLC